MFKTNANRIHVLPHASRLMRLLAVVLPLVAALPAGAQADWSGFYYIANNNAGNYLGYRNAGNFYLRPAEFWYNTAEDFTTDNGMPFLTTYQTQQEAATSLWQVVKVEGRSYYWFIHVATGKYLTVNDPLGGSYTKNHRMRVHLEDVGGSPTDRNHFYLEAVNSDIDGVHGFRIRCEDAYKNGNNKYLNPAGGNHEQLTPTSNEDPPTGGMVGFYTTDAGSNWYFEFPRPVCQTTSDGKVHINHPDPAAVIYYTTDGSDPVVPAAGDAPVAPTMLYSAAFLPAFGVTTVKATAVKGDLSSTIEYPLPLLDTPAITFDFNTLQATISTTTPGATLYYTTDGTTPTRDESVDHGTTPIVISVTTTTEIKAIAFKQGWRESGVATQSINQVATPVITFDGTHVVITCATPGATIFYTVGEEGSVEDPTTSSTRYSIALTDVTGLAIKAFAVRNGWISSAVAEHGTITLQCATPVIRRGSGDTFTITCASPADGVTIYYTVDGSTTPTTSSSAYTAPVAIASYPVTVKAIAVADGYANSEVATQTIDDDLPIEGGYILIASAGDFDLFVEKANTTAGAALSYRVTDAFTVSSPAAITEPFTGTFDGGYHAIGGLDHALFNTVDGGTVKNVVLDGVSVDGSGNKGAICDEATGASRIYNCGVLGGTVSGDNAGGLVGHVASGSTVKVINCYNYANVSGSSYAAGIVGRNEGTVGDVRIALCMMYGNVTGTTTISPVYAGNHASNVQDFSEYNYWRYKATLPYTAYNDQLAIDKDEYLTRFPFYRHILNTHHELASFFLFGDYTDAHVDELGHWTLKPDVAPYPILEPWVKSTKKITVDLANNLPVTAADYAGKLVDSLGNSGLLNVTVKIGTGVNTLTQLPITDMDTLCFDYTWGKVVLPFANEFTGWTPDYDYICTGWKITSVTKDGTPYTSSSVTNYNFADRNNPQKDIYDANNPYIFAQGGNYIVPYGVTAITIEASFARAYYLSDATYEVAYDADYGNPTGLGGNVDTTYHGKTVYTDLATLVNALSTTTNPHSQAIVLVGNYHYRVPAAQNSEVLNKNKAVTIMSVDDDCNQEPDYGWYMANLWGRLEVPSLRFDFVPNIELGRAARVSGSSTYPAVGMWHTRGWFELTETCVSKMIQCEINSSDFLADDDTHGNNRWIANSGCFVQIVRGRDNPCNKLSYIQIGGNAQVGEFYPGNHSARNYANKLVPINVTGGEVQECYMTGYGKGTAVGSDIRFWCAGGKIGKFLGAYMENPSTAGVNMTAEVDHARIGRFFGGGTSPNARITGNIDVTIDNSLVDFYCGGPEFGDMNEGKTVTTRATNTTFGVYYGAGFGGTAITYFNDKDQADIAITDATVNYPSDYFGTYYGSASTGRLKTRNNYGVGTCYKTEFIHISSGNLAVARFYTGYAQFSLATTGTVTNTLKGCTVETNFYGAGCQGKVSGDINSTLTSCMVKGNVYAAGFKAESNEVKVYPTTTPTMSVYTKETGIFSDPVYPDPEIYTWQPGTGTPNQNNKYIYSGITAEVMATLGTVTGSTHLTIEGNSVVGTDGEPGTGSVYGGGQESAVEQDTHVLITGSTLVRGNVYGGGNEGEVHGDANVIVRD